MKRFLKFLLKKMGIYVAHSKMISDPIINELKRKEEKYNQLIKISFGIFNNQTSAGHEGGLYEMEIK